MILTDTVETVESMKKKNFKACYIFLRLSSEKVLIDRLNKMGRDEIETGLRIGTYSSQLKKFNEKKSESFFDCDLEVDDVEHAYFRLANAISNVDGCILPKSDVWGFGRCLWDESQRVSGEYPLRISVMGPALSGKTIQCELLSARFKFPHIAIGDLLRNAVEKRTELGLRARRYIDASRNVPDDIIVELLNNRLQMDDCRQYGWILDGFPKTMEQAKRLNQLKIVPDKVIFLFVEHAELVRRSEGRRIDPISGKIYNMKDDVPENEESLNRITIRHDDLLENVKARLTHYESNESALKTVYHEMGSYIDGGQSRQEIYDNIVNFITTEYRLSNEMVISSASSLSRSDYIITGVQKYQRQRLLCLQPLGKGLSPSWVDLCHLPDYVSDFVLLRNQTEALCTQYIDCLTLDSLTGTKMMFIDSPEPVTISCSLSVSPQPSALEVGVQKAALVISGHVMR